MHLSSTGWPVIRTDLLEVFVQSKQQPITQLEFYAIVAANATWLQIERSKVTWFVDNLVAKTVLAKGCSKDPILRKMLKRSIELAMQLAMQCFYAWVPSGSNPVDGHSRGSVGQLAVKGAKPVRPTLPSS
eukprot:3480714-Amphidinium_carterae.1